MPGALSGRVDGGSLDARIAKAFLLYIGWKIARLLAGLPLVSADMGLI